MSSKMINITPNAQEKMQRLLKSKLGEYNFIRLGIQSKGCAGLSYKIEFAKEIQTYDEKFDFNNFSVLVNSKDLIYLAGIEIDFKESDFESGFVFNNPNQKGSCACGDSFYI